MQPHANLTLSYDGTLFTEDSTHFSVTISGTELTSGTTLKSNTLTIKAVVPLHRRTKYIIRTIQQDMAEL